MRRTRNIIFAGLLAAFASGCAAPTQEAKRFFWPKFPNDPKVEWIAAYRHQHDFEKTGFQRFTESIAGTEDALKFERPMGIASDGAGIVYISDVQLKQVFVYDLNKKEVRLFGGKKASSFFQEPRGVCVDAKGNIYVVEAQSKKVLIFAPDEAPLSKIDIAKTELPIGMALDEERGRILVGDAKGHKVDVYDLSGSHLFSTGIRGGGDGEFNFPGWVAVTKTGNIVVSDSMNARVQVLDKDGKFIRKFGVRGDNPGEFQLLKGIAVDSEDHIYVADGKGNNVSIFSEKGEYLLTIGGPASSFLNLSVGGFLLPQGIFIDRNDRIYIADQINRRFQILQYMNAKYTADNPPPKPSAPEEKKK